MWCNFLIGLRRKFDFNKQFYFILAWCLGLFLSLHIIPQFTGSPKSGFSYSGGSAAFAFLSSAALLFSSVIVCQLGRKQLLIILCFMKAVLFGMSLNLLLLQYGSGAWLARWLFLFADSVGICFFLWFSLRQISTAGTSFRNDVIITISFQFIACLIDCFFLFPFAYRI